MKDNLIQRSGISAANKNEVEALLRRCQDGYLYDVILCSDYIFKFLGGVRIRYLSYVSNYNNFVTLGNP